MLRYLPHYYNGGTAAIWQTAGKLFQKKNAMNHLFIAFLIPYSDVKAMTAELQKIGTNINQIAKRVNATGTLYAQDIEDIKGAMAEIWQLQRSILSKAP